MEICEGRRSVDFSESFRGIEYRVRATSTEEGVELEVVGYGTFADVIAAGCPELVADGLEKVAAEEYERCLLEAVRRFKGGCE